MQKQMIEILTSFTDQMVPLNTPNESRHEASIVDHTDELELSPGNPFAQTKVTFQLNQLGHIATIRKDENTGM